MAGDWLKMEACTPEKSEVLAITAAMGWEDCDMTVGKLFRIWRWFDQQTVDGNAPGVTKALLDRIVGVTGFCDAMASVDWLLIHDGGISLPNFENHNGATAKSRAQGAKRAAKLRGSDKSNAPSVTDALPREEKRREEEKQDQKPAAADAAPKPKRKTKTALPSPFLLSTDMAKWARERAPRADLNLETEKFCNHWRAKGETRADWHATWRNWMLNAQQFAGLRQRPIAEPDFEDTSWANDLGPL